MGGDSKSVNRKKFKPSASDKQRAALVNLTKQMTVVKIDEVDCEPMDEIHYSRKLAPNLSEKVSDIARDERKDCSTVISIVRKGDQWIFSGTSDNVPYLAGLMLRFIVSGELNTSANCHSIALATYEDSLRKRISSGFSTRPGAFRYKPSAYIPNDPMFQLGDISVFRPLEPFFNLDRQKFLYNMSFHRSLIRLLDMSIVSRETYSLQRFGADWFNDTTDGIHAAGFVDFEHKKGVSIFSFRCLSPYGSPDRSVKLTGSSPYIGLFGTDDEPDDVSDMCYPIGFVGDCFVHPVLDFYIQRDFATIPYQYGYVQDSVFTHTLSVRPMETKGFVVEADPIAADLVKRQWKFWVCLAAGSYVWANYITIHLEGRLYTHAPFAVWRAMELLLSYAEELSEESSFTDSVMLPDWQGELFFQIPHGNAVK